MTTPRHDGTRTLPTPEERAALPPDGGQGFNRLIHEHSPYLLQHARNPVDWYPWGEEAFAKAHSEDKPVFLSIGYATCHWCHVMEHESFENAEVADLMNKAFICIKVDREERPDIDGVYMTVCQMLTGSGGWPLTVVMTPDKKPFFAGTYFPREGRFGRIGMLELVPRLSDAWSSQRQKLGASADEITTGLQRIGQPEPGEDLETAQLSVAFQSFVSRFDTEYGGFGRAPKFPAPHNLMFLLRHWHRTGEEQALRMVEETLQAMRRGGIWDHIGFGFHRYSTDREWLVPHFEKMLYDQALLVMAYTEAWQATGKSEYETTAREILTYVLRDMTDPAGGFYSAEDADSEGEEGKFYVWTLAELESVLGARESAFVADVYNVQAGGNFTDEISGHRTGASILHLRLPLARIAGHTQQTEQELRQRLESSRTKLLEAREKRVQPLRDDKIMTDWNGLVMAALAKAGSAFEDQHYTEAARQCAHFILNEMRTDGRLLHRFRKGEAAIGGHLDDYAFLVWGLLELYEATFDPGWLREAQDLHAVQVEHFLDKESGGFFFTANDAEKLLARRKEIYDGAIPSGNSVCMLNMLRLGRLTGEPEYEAHAAALGRAFSGSVEQPSAHTMLMCALDFATGPTFEVVIAGDPAAPDTKALVAGLRQRFIPNKVAMLRPVGGASTDEPLPDHVSAYSPVDGKAAAYVCRKFQCLPPITNGAQMVEILTGEVD
ncbi:thioredoxin domain-containing protein [Kiritimatiella glycovorans]|uniref:Thioredoxin-related protein n=1 Tax=Kiritimatiella glycovorans TaxID=1307763 RepID=A0A0G3EFU5_9BACT|nr:thioredoxin domain-containing protein [Kiritimatiella glycovorans]AKJ65233.1 Thioredoxin-related protein [Kiritimatiella glycovorans]